MATQYEIISCFECGIDVKKGTKSPKKYCSKQCKTQHWKKVFKENNPRILNVCTGTIGAIGELRVCVDLLSKGYHVYRAISPACPADLAITHNNKLYRVEVTTGYISIKGKLYHLKNEQDKLGFDIPAVIKKTGEISYFPELPS